MQPTSALILSFHHFLFAFRHVDVTYIEITPPAHVEKSPLATQELFSVIQQVIGRYSTMSLELISSRHEGIRYLVRVRAVDGEIVQKHVASYLPEVQFRVLERSYRPERSVTGSYYRIFELEQARHYAFPLKRHKEIHTA